MKLCSELYGLPTEHGLAELERMGGSYILVHTEMFEPDRWAETEPAMEGFGGSRPK